MENRNNIICTTNTSNEQHGWVGEDSTHYGPGLVATAETSISRVYVSNSNMPRLVHFCLQETTDTPATAVPSFCPAFHSHCLSYARSAVSISSQLVHLLILSI